MSKGLLDPKVDFVFKNIFGTEKDPKRLISFLNATLKPKKKIVSVMIKGTDIAKQFVEDKYSRMDIKATTSNDEIINIEIQLKDEKNMIKRSMYYLSKMYEEQLGNAQDYSMIEKTICINILNFKYLKTEKFHTSYRMKEIETHEELTDVIEMHFIEIPKLRESDDEKDMLVAWTEFLKNPESEKVRHLEMDIEEIRSAKDELIRMSNDDKEREIYDMRSKILKDKISELNGAEKRGEERGEKRGGEKKAMQIAKNLLDVLDNETIALKTGLTIEAIESLR
ncbi:Rpn family recombination-promoting nuclease/putative transposase [Clostridium gasigenes]|uniref:Rpn family recombination-promoting nuclease/putative transposase n=1 Tax=Clostridium gasigenes TaxID=94869 RepID=UPI001C0AE78F|nr:Rpn family recombination-promoting nuclease/putative transposase [Clostridium gasigenes]MBU3107556.1 Rpn family recombination-promoting nuclease/putative transposase [Clostridium gasigenes]